MHTLPEKSDPSFCCNGSIRPTREKHFSYRRLGSVDQFQSISAQSQNDKYFLMRCGSQFLFDIISLWTCFFISPSFENLLFILLSIGITSYISSFWSRNDFGWTTSTTKSIREPSSHTVAQSASNSFCICDSPSSCPFPKFTFSLRRIFLMHPSLMTPAACLYIKSGCAS